MADYRGGDRRTSSHGEGLIHAIRNGNTERQRKRDFNQKLAFTGIQAGLTGLGALASAAHSSDEREAATKAQRAENRADYLKTPAPDYKPMAAGPTDAKLPGWLTGGQGDRTELAMDNDIADINKMPGAGNPYDQDTMTTRALAELAKDVDEPAKPKVTWGSPRGGRGMLGSQ